MHNYLLCIHGHAWVVENSSWNFQKLKIKISILLNDFRRALSILDLRIELPIMTALSRSVNVPYSLVCVELCTVLTM